MWTLQFDGVPQFDGITKGTQWSLCSDLHNIIKSINSLNNRININSMSKYPQRINSIILKFIYPTMYLFMLILNCCTIKPINSLLLYFHFFKIALALIILVTIYIFYTYVCVYVRAVSQCVYVHVSWCICMYAKHILCHTEVSNMRLLSWQSLK